MTVCGDTAPPDPPESGRDLPCPTCRHPKLLSEFYANRSRPDGLHGECRVCSRERVRQRYWRAKRQRTDTRAVKERRVER